MIKGRILRGSAAFTVTARGVTALITASLLALNSCLTAAGGPCSLPIQYAAADTATQVPVSLLKVPKKYSGFSVYVDGQKLPGTSVLLANGIILTAQGVPFFQAGDEFLRIKFGNHNSCNAPDSINYLGKRRCLPRSGKLLRRSYPAQEGAPRFPHECEGRYG
jgi:hypothetical protein